MTTLRLATRDFDAFERAFDAQIAAFEESNRDIKVERHSFTIEEHYARFINRKGALDGEFDLYLGVTDWLPQAVRDGLLEDLDPFLGADPPEDWPGGWAAAMLGLPSASGSFYSLPWHDGPEIFHYRSDLFEDKEERVAFRRGAGRDLEPPRTWNEFLEIARFFTRPGLWGCCVAAAPDGHNNVYDFLIHLWSRGGVLLDPAGQPRFHEAAGVAALTYYSDLIHRHRVASPECLQLNSVDSGYSYAGGSAAMMWNWCGFAATAEMPESKIKGLNRCAPIPGGVSLNIFWALAILKGSKNKNAAYGFLKHCGSAKMDKITTMSGANGVRLSTWRDPEVRARFPYYGIIEDVHHRTRTLPEIPEYPAINEELNRAIERVTHGRQDPAASLSAAAREVEKILKR